jgi:hypothetical protein
VGGSGNKRVKTVVAGVEMKAVSSSRRSCLWGNAGHVDLRHQVCHTWVYRRMK